MKGIPIEHQVCVGVHCPWRNEPCEYRDTGDEVRCLLRRVGVELYQDHNPILQEVAQVLKQVLELCPDIWEKIHIL